MSELPLDPIAIDVGPKNTAPGFALPALRLSAIRNLPELVQKHVRQAARRG